MTDIMKNSEYVSLLQNIKRRITSARIAASRHVGRELILLYWDVGQAIIEKQKSEGWGTSIVVRLSKDLQREFPSVMGFSPQNLWCMRQFRSEYLNSGFLQQVVGEFN